MVAKIDDEVYVLNVIRIYSYFSFVSSVAPKKVEFAENVESDAASLKMVR